MSSMAERLTAKALGIPPKQGDVARVLLEELVEAEPVFVKGSLMACVFCGCDETNNGIDHKDSCLITRARTALVGVAG